MGLVSRILAGDRLALARAITEVENGGPSSRDIIREVYPHTGRAYVVGITGSPGVGKSSLVDGLIRDWRREGKKVGVIAVDPTSPFTGGALLGDRLRMDSHSLDSGVFIRSLATRGQLGGLSRGTGAVLNLLDAYGYDVVFIETVGTGQSEVEIMRFAHTVLVVVAPGMGDDVQAMKAGIMEIGDVFAVNKADREGADRTAMELQYALDLAPAGRPWRPPVVKTVASTGEGIPELAAKIREHGAFARDAGELGARRLRASEFEIRELLAASVVVPVIDRARRTGRWDEAIAGVATRKIDPYAAVEMLVGPLGEDEGIGGETGKGGS